MAKFVKPSVAVRQALERTRTGAPFITKVPELLYVIVDANLDVLFLRNWNVTLPGLNKAWETAGEIDSHDAGRERYADFGPMLATEKLARTQRVALSRSR
jgi:hypothetical protein